MIVGNLGSLMGRDRLPDDSYAFVNARHWCGCWYSEPASEDGVIQHPRPLYLGKHLDIDTGVVPDVFVGHHSGDAVFVRYRTGWLAR